MEGSTLINRKLFLCRAEIVFLIGLLLLSLKNVRMLFQLNLQSFIWLQPTLAWSDVFLSSPVQLRCSVLAWRFSSEWNVNMAPLASQPELRHQDLTRKFPFFSIIILFFVFLLDQNRTNTAPAVCFSCQVDFNLSTGWQCHYWHYVAIINYLNWRHSSLITPPCQLTSKWKSCNNILSALSSGCFPVRGEGDQRYSSGYRETQSRQGVFLTPGNIGGRIMSEYGGGGGGVVWGNVSGKFWLCFLQCRITPDWLFMFNQQYSHAELGGVSGCARLAVGRINVRYLGWNIINIICCSVRVIPFISYGGWNHLLPNLGEWFGQTKLFFSQNMEIRAGGIKLQESNNLHGKMLYLVLKIGYWIN